MTKHSDLYIACKRLQLVLIWEGFNYTATSYLAPKYAPGRPDLLSKDNRDSLSRDKQQTADMSGGHFQIQTFKAIDERRYPRRKMILRELTVDRSPNWTI